MSKARQQALQVALLIAPSARAALRAVGYRRSDLPKRLLPGVLSAEELRERLRTLPGADMGTVVHRLQKRASAADTGPDSANKADELLCRILGYLADVGSMVSGVTAATGADIRRALLALREVG